MKSDDYSLHAIKIDLMNTTTMDKVEMIEETSKVVSLDFIKNNHYQDKMQEDHSLLK